MNNKDDNITYNYLTEYIRNNKDVLSKNELRFLINYAIKVNDQNIENVENVSYKNLTDDLIKLNNTIKSGELTSLSFERLERLLYLFDRLLNKDNLDDISYDLDKLYLENDMPVRVNSTLVHKLYSVQKKGNK